MLAKVCASLYKFTCISKFECLAAHAVCIYYGMLACFESVRLSCLWLQWHLANVEQHPAPPATTQSPPPSRASFLYLTRRFWNQILTCFSDRRSAAAIWMRRSLERYMLAANSCSRRSNCVLVNAVRRRFIDAASTLAPSGDSLGQLCWHSASSASAIVDVTEPARQTALS